MEMVAYEAFIRRASEVGFPFMLKGSYVTRQYFPNPLDRIPADLDWVYLENLNNIKNAEKKFDEWLIAVTEYKMFDNVTFKSFKENTQWLMMDYAMADDFPTVKTDLLCKVQDGEFNAFPLDISFNLDIDQPPVPLLYRPLKGNSFTVPYSAPLSLQVSWKLHQTLVRPRFKDILDLTWLLQHPDFDSNTLQQTLQSLANECSADNADIKHLAFLVNNELDKLFTNSRIEETWDYWRHNYRRNNYLLLGESLASDIIDTSRLPANLSVFKTEFTNALHKAGFDINVINNLPLATWQRNKEYLKPVPENEIRKPISIKNNRRSFFDFFSRFFK